MAPRVIVIPPTKKNPQVLDQKKNLRVAAYCRVSTNSEEQLTSYQNQPEYFTEKISREPNWTLVEVFADEGKTGTSTCKRKNFLRMIRMCRQGKIDMILAKSVSRFARNTVDTIEYTRELRGLGIPVVFEEYNINSIYPESEFLITLYGAIAQNDSETLSSNVKWGKRQSMKSGHVNMQYKKMLGYERGADGKPVINEDQAQVVRYIYQRYRMGDTLREIKNALEHEGMLTAGGSPTWTISCLKSILTNEKYCGDALLQKTFILDCISKKVIKNTGQLTKYLIQDHHPAIVSREEFEATQVEMARRRAFRGLTRKTAPAGLGKYSGKYALSNIVFCGECGTVYRRCVWTQHGQKRAVWRCGNRLDYGKRFCTKSPTIDEEPLHQAILRAVNMVMEDRDTLEARLTNALAAELLPMPGETMSIADIDRTLEELGKEFDTLLAEASSGNKDCMERFGALSQSMMELKERKKRIEGAYRENDQVHQRINTISVILRDISEEITEWDEGVIHQILEKVTILSRDRIRVTFRGGAEVEQELKQVKRMRYRRGALDSISEAPL